LDGRGLKVVKNIDIPENEKDYPDPKTFGEKLPLWGMFGRHLRNCSFSNIKLNLSTEDYRPGIVLNDALNLKFKDLTIHEIIEPMQKPIKEPGKHKIIHAEHLIWLEKSEKLIVSYLDYNGDVNCNAPTLFKIDESSCKNITIHE
jgi:hypothetical protein